MQHYLQQPSCTTDTAIKDYDIKILLTYRKTPLCTKCFKYVEVA